MRKPREDADSNYRMLAIAAAKMQGANLSQQQIGKWLQRSQPEVSRLLAYAEKHKILKRLPTFLKGNVDPAELEAVDRRFFVQEELQAHLRQNAPAGLRLNLRVFPEGDDEFTAAAAGCVIELLQEAECIGVMWGRTIQRAVSWIDEHREILQPLKARERKCIPLCGDPVHQMNLRKTEYSASYLAAKLGRAINPRSKSEKSKPHRSKADRNKADQPCLIGVPAYLPCKVFRSPRGDSPGIADIIQEIPGHRDIFGPTSKPGGPCVDRVDTVITGLGIIASASSSKSVCKPQTQHTAAHEETGDFIRERLDQEDDINEGTLSHLIYGDIGGWMLEKEGLEPKDRKRVQDLNRGWTGISGDQLARIAAAAGHNGTPGIILMAAGPAKGQMVWQLVKLGMVNELLIDSMLAAALKSLLLQSNSRDRRRREKQPA